MIEFSSRIVALVLSATLLSLAGCSAGSDEPTPDAADATSATASEGEPAPADAASPTSDGDTLACADMETLLAKVSVAAARWQPEVDPFDSSVSSTLLIVSQGMETAETKAVTPAVRSAIHESTTAFGDLARATSGDNRKKVQKAIGDTRVAYKSLKQVCVLER